MKFEKMFKKDVKRLLNSGLRDLEIFGWRN